MSVGILGTKLGMTQIFDDEGNAVPVTVIQAGPCVVTQVKTAQTDGYTAVQIGYEDVPEKALTKPQLGHLAKAGVETPVRHLKEYRVEQVDAYELGQSVTAEQFEPGQLVDVTGTSIGRGFAGNQRRHNFHRGPMSHGSKNHRLPGSIGPGTTPGRVYPGKKMAGQLGNKRVTSRKLQVMKIDAENNLLVVKGTIPGKPGGLLSIAPANIVS